MAELSEGRIISELDDFSINLKFGSPLLDKLLDIGRTFRLDAESLCHEWVAYSTRKNCELELDTLEQWEGYLHTSISSRKTPTSRRPTSKMKRLPSSGRSGGRVTLSEDNLDSLFDTGNGAKENILCEYGTPHHDKQNIQLGSKRAGENTPTTPTVSSKSRHMSNGSTPVTPRSANPVTNGNTPYRTMAENGMFLSSPSVLYHQRKNSGHVMCSLNDSLLPGRWEGSRAAIKVQHYDPDTALTASYQYMFQKVSEKSLILLERIKELGEAICHHNDLSSPLSLDQPSLEPAVFTGEVVCEGEGRLNARSCLLEGSSHSRQNKGVCVRMEIPDSISCSLFPGQVVAVEGINNYNGIMIPSRIYDQGVLPPLPKRSKSIQGFTILCASGPFTTTDNLAMDPLHDLLNIVSDERPDVLLLCGPFLDSTHPLVQSCDVPDDMKFEDFFLRNIFQPIYKCIESSRTKLILVPSQLDVHHPWMVYPQPPFQPDSKQGDILEDLVFRSPDPTTLDVGGVCIGHTSTDILFHLSARSMFRGHTGDRMAQVARNILRQQCYYPLLPAYRPETSSAKHTAPQTSESETPVGPHGGVNLAEEASEVNLDLIHMFDYRHACMPARPDLLILPSNLKPFVKVLDGCLCINPGHLTKRASGGTFARIFISEQLEARSKEDLSSDIGVQIAHI